MIFFAKSTSWSGRIDLKRFQNDSDSLKAQKSPNETVSSPKHWIEESRSKVVLKVGAAQADRRFDTATSATASHFWAPSAGPGAPIRIAKCSDRFYWPWIPLNRFRYDVHEKIGGIAPGGAQNVPIPSIKILSIGSTPGFIGKLQNSS